MNQSRTDPGHRPTPDRANQPSTSVRTHWIVLASLYVMCLLFVVETVGRHFYEFPVAATAMPAALIAAICGMWTLNHLRMPSYGVLIVGSILALLACANVATAVSPTTSAVLWIVWFSLLGLFVLFSRVLTSRQVEDFGDHLWQILLTPVLTATLLTYFHESGEISTRWQTVGFYAGGLFVTGMCAQGATRWIGVTVGAVAIYLSGSRGAMAAAFFACIPYVVHKWRRGSSAVAAVVVLVAVLAALPLTTLGAEFLGRKTRGGQFSLFESISHTSEVRLLLFADGWDLARQSSVTGWGLGDAYVNNISPDGRATFTTHNGFLSTLVECGFPLASLLFVLLGISLWRLCRASTEVGHTRIIFLCFTAYCLQRAVYENYLVLNVGNGVTVLFLLANVIVLTNPVFITAHDRRLGVFHRLSRLTLVGQSHNA
jgi:hypothetical protein